MKDLITFINEKLLINKNYKEFKRDTVKVNDDNLYDMVLKETAKQLEKANNENLPIDLNHIDVSKITKFDCLFDVINDVVHTDNNDTLRYIDISEWDVSNVERMRWMFADCKDLVSIGDLSNWQIDNLMCADEMFRGCENLEYIGDISKWNIENADDRIIKINNMFDGCKKLKTLPSWYNH